MQWIVISDYIAFISNGYRWNFPIIGYSICVYHSFNQECTLLAETISHSAWVIFVYPAIFYSLFLTILLLIIRRKMDLKEGING